MGELKYLVVVDKYNRGTKRFGSDELQVGDLACYQIGSYKRVIKITEKTVNEVVGIGKIIGHIVEYKQNIKRFKKSEIIKI